MELTSKQRAQLRGLANTIDTIVQVGKEGINENLVKQVDDALEAREIIKGKLRQCFDGKIVRKDLTKKIKEGLVRHAKRPGLYPGAIKTHRG